MGFLDTVQYLSISILYNIFVHCLASFSYKDLQYEDKVNKTTTILFIFGIAGYVTAKLVFENKKNKLENSVVGSGLKTGGVLLIITSLFVNWENMSEEMKIIFIGCCLLAIIWFSYNDDEKMKKRENK